MTPGIFIRQGIQTERLHGTLQPIHIFPKKFALRKKLAIQKDTLYDKRKIIPYCTEGFV